MSRLEGFERHCGLKASIKTKRRGDFMALRSVAASLTKTNDVATSRLRAALRLEGLPKGKQRRGFEASSHDDVDPFHAEING